MSRHFGSQASHIPVSPSHHGHLLRSWTTSWSSTTSRTRYASEGPDHSGGISPCGCEGHLRRRPYQFAVGRRSAVHGVAGVVRALRGAPTSVTRQPTPATSAERQCSCEPQWLRSSGDGGGSSHCGNHTRRSAANFAKGQYVVSSVPFKFAPRWSQRRP